MIVKIEGFALEVEQIETTVSMEAGDCANFAKI